MRNERKTKKYIKSFAMLFSVALLLVSVVGGTFAYLATRTESVTNTFEAVQVSCQVVEGEENAYTVKNTSDVKAYLRVAVVVNWVDDEGHIHWKQPSFSVDLSPETLIRKSSWEKGDDGIYYYKEAVEAEAGTTTFEVKVADGESAPNSDYSLRVQVLAEAIQGEPEGVVETVWNMP